jgi:prohibitin 2
MWIFAMLGVLGGIALGILGGWKAIKRDREGSFESFQLGAAFPLWILAAIVFFVGITLTAALITVRAGERGVVLRFSGVTGRILDPGLHIITPFIETVQPISVAVQIVKVDEDAASHDLQMVQTQVTLAYYQDPCCVQDIWQKLNNDSANRVINPAILEAVKANTAQYDAEQLISKRPVVRDGVEGYVRQRLAAHHIIVDAVSITNFHFSKEYEAAIEAKVTAAQEAQRAENILKKVQIEAEQRIAQAKGEAEALRAQKEQITPELLQLRTIEMMRTKWDGTLPSVYVSGQGGALPMFDILQGIKKR